jgi:gas vesicle protein
MNTTGKFVLGLLGAAAAGTVIGLLIAPDKGSETRKKMIEGVGKFAIDLANVLQSGKDELANAEETALQEAEGLKNDIKQRARTVQESFT